MRFWLARRSSGGNEAHTAPQGRSLGRSMSMQSLEHMVRNRVKMFLRHTWLVTLVGTIIAGALVWAGVHYSLQATVMRIAVGPPNSSNAKFVDVLIKLIGQSHERVTLQVIPTDGGAATATAMATGQADLAVLPTTVGDSPDWPVVAILRQNVMAFIVPAPPPAPPAAAPAASAPTPAKAAAKPAAKGKKAKAAADDSKSGSGKSGSGKKKSAKAAKSDDDSDDDSDDSSSDDSKDSKKLKITDLAGKKVGIVIGNEASADILNAVLAHYGVPVDKVQELPIDPKDLPDAVKNNKIDVLFVAGSSTGKAISDAVAAATRNGTAPSFIEIDQGDGIAKRNPAYDSADIDAGTFGGSPPTPGDDLKGLSFAEHLVARKNFSHSTIADLSKLIYTSRLSIASQLPGEVKIEAPSTDKDADVVVHPGTLDYLNDDQKSFFDKYGDDIFYGMLIFPVFGSAIAGVASFLISSSRTRRLRLLQHVLDLVRKAHGAQTLEAIEHLQVEADDLVIAIVHAAEHEEFDEKVRMSFSFALDQLRFAIAARRTAILDHPDRNAGTGSGTGKGSSDSSGGSSKAAAA